MENRCGARTRAIERCKKNNIALQPKYQTMIIANKEILDDFVQAHAQAAAPLNKWIAEVRAATWKSHSDLKKHVPISRLCKERTVCV